jgi:hypothetical protein
VTVCIASLFHWNYAMAPAEPDVGLVAITASDRMITAFDVQYEPPQLKVAFFGTSLILIAGDFSIHTQALKETSEHLRGKGTAKPFDIALIYGRAIQAIKRRQAEDLILAPLGLNTDGFVSRLTDQMQGYLGSDVEALVVGSDGTNAQIYSLDSRGTVSGMDDVGFAAIGMGAWHAKSRLMQSGYTNAFSYIPALSAVFAAKKNAEVAPGVGTATDMHLVFRGRIERLDVSVATKMRQC